MFTPTRLTRAVLLVSVRAFRSVDQARAAVRHLFRLDMAILIGISWLANEFPFWRTLSDWEVAAVTNLKPDLSGLSCHNLIE